MTPDLTDKELSLSIELAQARVALAQMQQRACQNEVQIANIMGADSQRQLQTLFVEQERRERAKQQPAPAEVTPPVEQ
jgi:hypothetical protein